MRVRAVGDSASWRQGGSHNRVHHSTFPIARHRLSQCDIGGSRMQAWNPSAQLTGELRNLGYSNPRRGDVSCIVDPSLSHPALEEGSATRSVRRYLPIVKEGLRT
ncbi:MAG: hypothetical protein M1447_00495, partial [Gammaproteobacteria bacterium]|nr:hypothetical protein [Gammaproteobacteria bacterium]